MAKTKQDQLPWTKILIVTVLFTAPFILGGLYNVCEVLAPLCRPGTQLTGIDWKGLLEGFLGLFIGAGLLALVLCGRRWQLRRTALKASAPDKPWLWREDWRAGVIRDSSRLLVLVFAAFTAPFIAISFPTGLMSWRLIHQSPVDVARVVCILVFPAVGAVLLLVLLVLFLRWRKVGNTYFEMATLPGIIGGKLDGTIRIRRHLAPDGGFRLRLSCTRTVTTGSGQGKSTSTHVLHQQELTIARELLSHDRSQTAIPVLFGIPYRARPTGDRIGWRLEVEAELPGLDYRTHFDVPVFKTPESSPSFRLDESPIAQYVARKTPQDVLRDQRIFHEFRSGGEVFRFPMFRPVAGRVVLPLASSGLLVGVTIFSRQHLWGLCGAFSLAGLLVWWLTLDHLFWCSRIEIRHGRVKLRHGLFGWRCRTFAASDVAEVLDDGGSQINQRVYYNVRFVLRASQGNKRLTVGKRITDKKVVDSLVRMCQDALGLDRGRPERSSTVP